MKVALGVLIVLVMATPVQAQSAEAYLEAAVVPVGPVLSDDRDGAVRYKRGYRTPAPTITDQEEATFMVGGRMEGLLAPGLAGQLRARLWANGEDAAGEFEGRVTHAIRGSVSAFVEGRKWVGGEEADRLLIGVQRRMR